MDELWTQVRQGSQVVWVWAEVEASSKLVSMLKLGPRTMDLACAVVHDLCQMLQPVSFPSFTSDGLKLYFYALTAHFGRCRFPEVARKPVWGMSSSFLYAELKKIPAIAAIRELSARKNRSLLKQQKSGDCSRLEWRQDNIAAPSISLVARTQYGHFHDKYYRDEL